MPCLKSDYRPLVANGIIIVRIHQIDKYEQFAFGGHFGQLAKRFF